MFTTESRLALAILRAHYVGIRPDSRTTHSPRDSRTCPPKVESTKVSNRLSHNPNTSNIHGLTT